MRLKKCVLMFAGLWLLALACRPAEAGVRVGVGINIDLPVFTFQAPPELVVIPGSYVYYVPEIDYDILFYEGQWYRFWNNRWHRSRHYNGPWVYIGPRYVPGPFLHLPPDYRKRKIYKRMRYDDVNRHWNKWEKERYWEREYDWWREKREIRRDRRDDRGDDRNDRRDDRGGRGHRGGRDDDRHDRHDNRGGR